MFSVIAIVCLAVILRIAGILYGLPLASLIADESGLIFASLKMIELQTLLPGLHASAFQHILYYPPYIAYVYIGPFLMFAGIKYLILGMPAAEFQNYLAANLSPFFIIARSINIILAAVSVWLVYNISFNLFKNKKAALVSCFFLATSILHISLSMVARHWVPASFLFLLGFYFLTKNDWLFKKRYFWATITMGLGMGITPIISLFGVIILSWYIFYEDNGISRLFKEKFFYLLFCVFLLLATIPVLLYPGAYGFFRGNGGVIKTVWGVIASPVLFLKFAFITEPVLMLFAVIGLIAAYISHRKLFWPAACFVVAYSAVFYLIYHYLHRFELPLICFLVIFAGHGFMSLWERFGYTAAKAGLIIFLSMPLIVSLRFSYLVYHGDSRVLAREWAEKNLPADSKVMVAGGVRLLTTEGAVTEKKNVDANSINKFDGLDRYTEEARSGAKIFYALNLDYVDNDDFYKNISEYLTNNKYEYLIVNDEDKRFILTENLKSRMSKIKSFGFSPDYFRHYNNEFYANPAGLFSVSGLGPLISIYKIQ